MLRRVKVKGYKSLRDVEVNLQQLAVLFGPNAAGKSNFLDALYLLSRMAASRTLKQAFEPPYRGTPLESFSFGPEGIEGLTQRESATFSIEVDVELSRSVVDSVNRQVWEYKRPRTADSGNGNGTDHERPQYIREKYLRYRIEVEVFPASGFLRVADEYLAALNTRGEPTKARQPFIKVEEGRIISRMEGQGHPTHYEIGLDHTIISLPHYPPHYPHLLAMRQELENWFFFYFEPRERMRAPNPVKEVHHIGTMGEDLASFLNTLKVLNPAQFRGVEKALHRVIPSIDGIDVRVNRIGEVDLSLIEGQTPIPAKIVSEGTLRLLGLFALQGAKEPPSLLGFEEPENGVHPRRIELVAEYLKTMTEFNAQIIATTHSPILANLIPEESLLVCNRKQGATTIRTYPILEKGLWRKGYIDQQIDDEDVLAVSERILRGDFDA